MISLAVDGTSRVVRPEAAVEVVSGLGFPFVLALLVVLFLLLQPRLDARDPKLRSAPLTVADTLVAYEEDLL